MSARSLGNRLERLARRLARRRSWRITVRWHDDPPPEPRPGLVVVKLAWDERDSAELAAETPLDTQPEGD
jgi:hypothetical protein